MRRPCLARVWLTAVLAGGCGGSPEPARTAASSSAAPRKVTKSEQDLPELDGMVVARALRGNEAQLRDCFAAGGAPVSGFMRLGFVVEPTGEVGDVEIESSSFAEPQVAACLEEHVGQLRFEARQEPQQARWTFVAGLKAQSDDPAQSAKQNKKRRKSPEEPAREQGVLIDKASRGSLEPEEIEDVVHAGFGLFAHCYREGLDRHPRLAGVVRLRMVIGRDGVVDELRDSGSEIPDREVVDCVAEGFFALRFPKPRSGTVRLLYRIVFDNG